MSDTVEVNATNKYGLNLIVSDGQPPPSEMHGDVFDRQRVMKNFDQHLVEQQRIFVLGVGGIGSSVAMCLVRMGVDTIYLLDRDFVEASNLNRQILFTIADVGRSKVEAAVQHLKEVHNLRSNICTYHLDAVTHWASVVEIAEQSTVIFNNVDYGAVFDYAVNSLCKSLGILYIAGSTYANNIEINLFSGLPDDSCWACCNYTIDSFKHIPAESTTIDDIHRFLKDTYNISGEQSRSIVEECANQLHIQVPVASERFTTFMLAYQEKTLHLLLPQKIKTYQSIEFIPKDRSFPTRTVGSWVGVCVSGSCLMVNTWIQYLMQTNNSSPDTHKSFHNWNQFNLSMFGGGYYVAGFPNGQDLKCCPVCSDMKQIAEQNSQST